MKVAIIGAGIAGLSCALELKRHGIIPTIYEKKPSVGHPLEHTITTFNIFNMYMTDPLKKIYKNFGIAFTPMYELKKMTMKGPSKLNVVEGKLGYVFKRGVEEYSLENQLNRQVALPIMVDNYIDMENIRKKYDFIVVATGDDSIARQMGIWYDTFSVYIRAANVLGNFDVGSIDVWLDNNFSKSCYCYLLPNNAKEACMVFNVNDSQGDEMEHYWKEFLFSREIQYKIIETKDHLCRLGYPELSGVPSNIYFIGNAGGYIDDFLGFGVANAIETGIYSAQAIACGKDYFKLTKHLLKNLKQLHQYRLTLNKFDNGNIDELIGLLNIHPLKQMVYNNPLFKVRNCSMVPKIYNKIKYK